MNSNTTLSQNITLPKFLIRQGGVVILPLEKYEEIIENLEMLQSKKLPKEIEKARKEVKMGQVISLEKLAKKLGITLNSKE